MPFLRQMIGNDNDEYEMKLSIHTSISSTNHQGLPSLLAGVTEKQSISFSSSWIFDSKSNVNSIVDNAQSSWMIGSKELSSFAKGSYKEIFKYPSPIFIHFIPIFEITGTNKKSQTFTTPDNLLGPQNAIWRLNWTHHNLKEVLFQSSKNQYKAFYQSESEFFFVQVPACPKDSKEQGKKNEE